MIWTGVGTRSFHKLKYYNRPNPSMQFAPLFPAAGFLDRMARATSYFQNGSILRFG
jgi:hypothetical protein